MRSRFPVRLAPLLVAALAVAPAPAALAQDASSTEATTTKGGSCAIEALAERAGAAVTYGGRVSQCSARFGVRGIVGRAILYEGINTARTVAATPRERAGGAPFEIADTYDGEADAQYEGRFGVTVQIKGGKSKRKPKRPEKWIDPGPGCTVTTTDRAGDTLGCTLSRTLGGAAGSRFGRAFGG